MLVMTAHSSFLAYSEEQGLHHRPFATGETSEFVSFEGGEPAPKFRDAFQLLAIHPNGNGAFTFSLDNCFASANPDGSVAVDRPKAMEWEHFIAVEADSLPFFCRPDFSPESEMERFARQVAKLNAEGRPVKIYCGAGYVPRVGFLNLDITLMAQQFAVARPDEFFLFPFANIRWDIPDESVDYVFHEDFIEHIPQIMQWQFMAEVLRVLKKDCYHRINTPDLLESMRIHSDFSKGVEGVYTGELQWEHINILSRAHLKEIAEVIGYRSVHFTPRHQGLSAHCVDDFRPGADRDEVTGNIYADLLK